MREVITTITSKGQVTVPVSIRRALGLKTRDRVSFTLTDGGAELRPFQSALDRIAGSVKPRKKPEDFKELRALAIEEIVENAIKEMG
jgi:AbrB family looped-hinge helix DNA binding protein